MVPFVGGRQTKKPKLLLLTLLLIASSHPPSLLNEWLDRWRSEWGGTRSAESENSFFLFGKKKDFSGFGGSQTIFQRFRRFYESAPSRDLIPTFFSFNIDQNLICLGTAHKCWDVVAIWRGFPSPNQKFTKNDIKDHIKITNHPKNVTFSWKNNMLRIA